MHMYTCGHCVCLKVDRFYSIPKIDSACGECSNYGEILQTLRFGERVKTIRNQPVINEITEDAVNDLSDQIRQLKVQYCLEHKWFSIRQVE